MRRSLLCLLATGVLALAACGDDEPLVEAVPATYEVELPEHWSEATEAQLEAVGDRVGRVVEATADDVEVPQVDVTSLWLRGRGSRTAPSALVTREPVADDLSPDEVVELSIGTIERVFSQEIAATPKEVGPVEVAGEEWRAFDYTIVFDRLELRKRLVHIFHEDDVYTLTLTAPASTFERAARELDKILASWRWSST